jgi:hypothetical protein
MKVTFYGLNLIFSTFMFISARSENIYASNLECLKMYKYLNQKPLSAPQANQLIEKYKNSQQVMDQATLNRIIDTLVKKNPNIYLGQFQTSTVRIAMRIPEEVKSVRDFPVGLVRLLNLADKESIKELPYSDEYMSTKRGDYIVFQIDGNGIPDFYIAPKDSVNYEQRPIEETDQIALNRVQTIIQKQSLNLDLPYVGILNPQIIDVYSASELNIQRGDTFNLHASWGISEKPVGQDAVFARRHGSNDGEIWKIKVDPTTNEPMNYRNLKK